MNTIKQLQASYQSDETKCIENKIFIPRAQPVREFQLLQELFFPRYWNRWDLVENSKSLEEQIHQIQSMLEVGISPQENQATCCKKNN